MLFFGLVFTTKPKASISYNQIVDSYYAGKVEYVAGIKYEELIEAKIEGENLLWALELIIRANLKLKEYEYAEGMYGKFIKPNLSTLDNRAQYFNLMSLGALIYRKQKRYDQSNLLYATLLKKYPTDEPGYFSSAYLNMGANYWDTGESDSAKSNYEKSLFWAKIENNPDRISRALRKLSEYYREVERDYTRSLEYLNEASGFSSESEFIDTIIAMEIQKAVQLRDVQNDYEQAISILEVAIETASVANLEELVSSANVALMATKFQLAEFSKMQKELRWKRYWGIGISLLAWGVLFLIIYLSFYYPNKQEMIDRASKL